MERFIRLFALRARQLLILLLLAAFIIGYFLLLAYGVGGSNIRD